MLAFHMFCDASREAAEAVARAPLEGYLRSLVEAASDWTAGGLGSADYPNYDKIIEGLRAETFESQVAKGAAWIGTPAEIAEQIRDYQRLTDGFEVASLQVNFNTVPYDAAERSLRLFAREVMPHFADL